MKKAKRHFPDGQPKVDEPKGTSRNEHTGKYMRTKAPSDKFKENYDKIDWSKK